MGATEPGLDVPPDFSLQSGESPSEVAVAEYERERSEGTKVVVSVWQRDVLGERYQVRLSTVDLPSERTRDDLLIEEYGSRHDARHGMEDFLECFASAVEAGRLSGDGIDAETLRDIVDGFTGDDSFLGITERLSRLYR